MANLVTEGLQSMTERTTVETRTEELSCHNGKFYMFVTKNFAQSSSVTLGFVLECSDPIDLANT